MVMRARCWPRRCGVPLDERVRERIVAETRGNPLALLELPRGLTPARAGGRVRFAGRDGALGPDRGELPAPAGDASGGHPAAVAGRRGRAGRRPGAAVAGGRAARDRGRGSDAAEADGLLAIGARVPFRHPLVRSAVYRAASPRGAAGGPPRAGRRDRSGGRSRSPRLAPRAGGAGARRGRRRRARALGRPRAGARRVAAAAAFLERAAELTPEPARRARRALAAAQAKHQAGALDAALAPACHRGGGAAGRAAARPRRPAARTDRVRGQPRQRRSAAAAQGGQAARAARCTAGARDLSGCARGRDLRRPAGQRRRGCARWPRPRAQRRLRRSPRARPICSWTGWRC